MKTPIFLYIIVFIRRKGDRMKIGIKGQIEKVVENKDTAKVHGSGNLEVFATPAMIGLIEETCWKSVNDYLEDGQSTVGTHIDAKHLSASPLGSHIRCESELVEIDRKKLVFKAQVYDDKGMVGQAHHERFIVDSKKFMERAERK